MDEQEVEVVETGVVVHSGLGLDAMQRYARGFVMSGLFDDISKGAHDANQQMARAFTKIVAGQELGLPPFAAMRSLHIMDGKVELSAALMGALVKKSGRYDYRVVGEVTDGRAELAWTERRPGTTVWEPVGTSSFTIEEARLANLVRDGSAWKKSPSDMLFARALSRGFRRYCPDLGSGVYVEGELSEMPQADPEPKTIDVARPQPEEVVSPDPSEAAPVATPVAEEPQAPVEVEPPSAHEPGPSADWVDEDSEERDLTPVETHGGYLVKRDDLFEIGGSRGGKVRSCLAYIEAHGPATGLITAGSRSSPQVNIVATIAKELGLPCRVHVPSGEMTPELVAANDAGATVVQHKPGYNNVIIARARADAQETGYLEVPFGMECQEAVDATASQVANLPWGKFSRIVVPVGSGMTLAGILTGLDMYFPRPTEEMPRVLAVAVGADAGERLERWAPKDYQQRVDWAKATVDYHTAIRKSLGDLVLDPIYESKCVEHLQKGDLLWVVGIRATIAPDRPVEDVPLPEQGQLSEEPATVSEAPTESGSKELTPLVAEDQLNTLRKWAAKVAEWEEIDPSQVERQVRSEAGVATLELLPAFTAAQAIIRLAERVSKAKKKAAG